MHRLNEGCTLALIVLVFWNMQSDHVAYAQQTIVEFDIVQLEPNEVEEGYWQRWFGSVSELEEQGIIFSYDYQSSEDLSCMEAYMIAGARDCHMGWEIQPWYEMIARLAIRCSSDYETIPHRLTSEIVTEYTDCDSDLLPYFLELYKSPITGEYPILDSQEYVPGGLYIRQLTSEQKAIISSSGYPLVIDSDPLAQAENVTRNNREYISICARTRELTEVDVWYIRVYGESEVVVARLWHEPN